MCMPDRVMKADLRVQGIYRAHARPLFRYLVRLTLGDQPAAEDLLQETLLRAWRHIDRLPADLDAVRPWLFTVARNHAIDASRARRIRPDEVATIDIAWLPAAGDSVEGLLTA